MQTFGNGGHDEATRSADEVEQSRRACPECGTDGLRGYARYCMRCGWAFEDPMYLPVAALQATYNFRDQRKSFLQADESNSSMRRSKVTKPKSTNGNGASSTALAFVTYSLVPYLGILFCPGAVVMGGIGLIRQWRLPHVGGRKASYAGVVCGLVIFSAQVFLWWMLYKVPQWATGVEF